jgi:phospholipid/cholesterol/gamma-HCH transport system substrate-binding protein
MQKEAPPLGRILVALGFALSCFGLMLFLWVSFGGPIPLGPKSYRITAYFPEATTLALESDVRIGGVSVGKVKSIELAPPQFRVNGQDTTEAELEIEPEFAPIATDARAILRQKTLLGESYVELVPGTATEPGGEPAPVSLGAAGDASDAEAAAAEPIPEGGALAVGRTQEASQIDEIFNALDRETRRAGKRLIAESRVALAHRGIDLGFGLGNLGPFLRDAAEITALVRSQRDEVQGLIRDSGLVLRALAAGDRELAGSIVGAQQTFGGLADANEALAESVRILPTFEREARATVARVDRLRAVAQPVIRELLPVADDVTPTLRSVRRLAPPLRRTLVDLDPLLDAARTGFPALRDVVAELRPALDALDPFLANLNPVVRYLTAFRELVTTFLEGPPMGTASTLPTVAGQPAPRHFLRTLSYLSQESLAVYPVRLATNRGNGYLQIDGVEEFVRRYRIFPNFDCRNTDYTPTSQDPDQDEVLPFRDPPPDVHGGEPPNVDFAPCAISPDFPEVFGGEHAPNIFADP